MIPDLFLTNDVERGCGGSRDEGDAYMCTGTSSDGMPPEHFLLDPVKSVLGWQRGVYLIPENPNEPTGLHHALVFLGMSGKDSDDTGYPSPWSFLKETIHGVSRKIPKPLLRSEKAKYLVQYRSRMFFVHSKAIPTFDYKLVPPGVQGVDRPLTFCKHRDDWVENREQWELTLSDGIAGFHPWHPEGECKSKGDKTLLRDLYTWDRCSAALRDLSWFLHKDAEPVTTTNNMFRVEMPAFKFSGYIPTWPEGLPEGIEQDLWLPGIFMSTPITHFEIPHSDPDHVAEEIEELGFDVAITEW